MPRPLLVAMAGLAALRLALGQLPVTMAPRPHAVMAALHIRAPAADDGLAVCSVADDHFVQCVERMNTPLREDNVDEVLPCACCSAGRPFSTAYDECASYIATSLTRMTSEYTFFTAIYGLCGSAPVGFCQTTGAGSGGQATSGVPSIAATATSSPPDGAGAPPDCTSLALKIDECGSAMPLQSLAACYCYSTGARGSSTFVGDDIESWGSTCASWARTENLSDVEMIATVFTTMCDEYTSTRGATGAQSLSSPTRSSGGFPTFDNTGAPSVRATSPPTQTPSSPGPETTSQSVAGSGAAAAHLNAGAALVVFFAAVLCL